MQTAFSYRSFNGADLAIVRPFSALPASVVKVTDISMTNGNQAYIMGEEESVEGTVWIRKFAADGSVTVDKRISLAEPGRIHQAGSLLWLTGTQRTRGFGPGPFAYTYTR